MLGLINPANDQLQLRLRACRDGRPTFSRKRSGVVSITFNLLRFLLISSKLAAKISVVRRIYLLYIYDNNA